MTTSPGSRSSSERFTKRLDTTWSCSNVRYALNVCTGASCGMAGNLLDSLRGRRAGVTVGNVRQPHVIARSHLDQAARRARELARVRPVLVQRIGWRGRGRDELHAMIVQDVDQPREAAGLVGGAHPHPRYVGYEHDGEAAREFEIVAL